MPHYIDGVDGNKVEIPDKYWGPGGLSPMVERYLNCQPPGRSLEILGFCNAHAIASLREERAKREARMPPPGLKIIDPDDEAKAGAASLKQELSWLASLNKRSRRRWRGRLKKSSRSAPSSP